MVVAGSLLHAESFQSAKQKFGCHNTFFCHESYQKIFGNKFSVQLLEISEGKSQKLTMLCRRTNKTFTLLPHRMKNCIKFEFQTDRKNYVDLRQIFLAFILKMIKVCADGFTVLNVLKMRTMNQNGMQQKIWQMRKRTEIVQFLWSIM